MEGARKGVDSTRYLFMSILPFHGELQTHAVEDVLCWSLAFGLIYYFLSVDKCSVNNSFRQCDASLKIWCNTNFYQRHRGNLFECLTSWLPKFTDPPEPVASAHVLSAFLFHYWFSIFQGTERKWPAKLSLAQWQNNLSIVERSVTHHARDGFQY